MDENPKHIRWLLYALLMSIVFSAPAVAMYDWNGFPMQGEAADNAAYAYNGTVANGTVNGGVYIDFGHGADYANPPDGYVQQFSVPAHDNVVSAYLYGGVWHGTENYQGNITVEFTNATGTYALATNMTLGGATDTNTNVWTASHGVTWFWFNVTDYVDPGANTATGYIYKISSGFDGRMYGFKLVVVYAKSGGPLVGYRINQGHDALAYATSGHAARDYGYSYFNGSITPGDWDCAMLYCTWLTGDPGDNDTLWFNTHELDDSCTNYEQGAYTDSRWYVVKNDTIDYLQSTGNYAKYYRDTDNYVHWVDADLVLFAEVSKPDLVVDSIDDPVLVGHDSTHGYVVGHDYTINATIKNQGKIPSGACQAALYNASGIVDTATVPALDAGSSCEVVFDWHPYASGNIALDVVADHLGAVTESDETNNISSMNVNVLDAGSPDLVMTADDLVFLPTWKSNDTTIRITVTNNGTGDANNFVVKVYDDSTLVHTSPTMSVAAKGDKVINFTYSAPYGGPYPIRAVLDANNNVGESDEGNNETTKQLNVIEVMLWDSHHHGNTSTYNGEYSDNTDVVMFKVTKLVPENTTPWDALHSEADVTHHFGHPEQTYVYGIDGLIEDPDGPIYWYLYLNGRYVPNNELSGVIELQDGETMHWDFQKQIYTASDSFTPPCTVQSYVAGDDLHPEPFTHGFPMGLGSGDGYSREVWDTVIVYPAGSTDFQSIAGDIKNALVAGGVPAGRISITDNASVTSDQKENSNLILIGNYKANSLIADANAQHEEIGMPVYFDYTSCEIMEDDDDSTTPPQTYDHGAVVEAFDNPWNNGAFVDHAGSVIFMASGLNDGDAKDAAKMLISETGELDRFWRVRLAMCGDVDRDGDVDIGDRIRLQAHITNVAVPIFSERASDVDCDGDVDIGDRIRLQAHITNSAIPLLCCTGC